MLEVGQTGSYQDVVKCIAISVCMSDFWLSTNGPLEDDECTGNPGSLATALNEIHHLSDLEMPR